MSKKVEKTERVQYLGKTALADGKISGKFLRKTMKINTRKMNIFGV